MTGSPAPARAAGLRFRLAGFPVHLDLSFFLVVGLIAAQRIGGLSGWQGAAAWFLAVLLGVLVHELGHAVAFRRYGLEPTITLYAMGGLTSARGRLTVGRSLVSTLAGPGIGMAFGGLVWWLGGAGLWPDDTVFWRVLRRDLLFVNIAWGIVNLLPLYPLDGGQAFEAILRLAKARRPVRTTSIAGLATATAAGLWAVTANAFFLLLIAGWLGTVNWRRLQDVRGQQPPQGPPHPPAA